MATTKSAPCECGCGKQTIRPEARYIPGHDAKHKSQLVATALAGGAAGKAAEAKIRAKGWELHLAISRAKAERIAAQKARVAAAKAGAKAPAAPARGVVAKAKAAVAKVANPAGSDGSVPDLRLASEREPALAEA